MSRKDYRLNYYFNLLTYQYNETALGFQNLL